MRLHEHMSPLYTYSCKSCHDYIERRINTAARDAQTCNVCGHPLKRRFSLPHIAPVPGIPNAIGNELESKAKKLSPDTNFTLGDETSP